MPLVAVDQVKNTIPFSTIRSSVSSGDAGLNEEQSSQSTNKSCTELEYNIFSPHDSETLLLYVEGPVIILGYLNAPFKLNFFLANVQLDFKFQNKQTHVIAHVIQVSHLS